MKTKLLCILPVCLLLGCASLSTERAKQARKSRDKAAETIRTFGRALANDEVETAMDQVSPLLEPEKREEMYIDIKRATWLSHYTDYQLDADKAVNRLDLDTWLGDTVELYVPATNADGDELSQWMVLRKTGGDWKIGEVPVRSPYKGVDVDLPSDDREKVVERVSNILTKLRKGRYAEVSLTLPEATQFVIEEGGWLSFLWGGRAGGRHVFSDLQRLDRLDIHRWPNPEEHLPSAYVSTNAVMVIYTLPYSCPEMGISDDVLRMEMLMSEKEKEWNLVSIRLYGEAIRPE